MYKLQFISKHVHVSTIDFTRLVFEFCHIFFSNCYCRMETKRRKTRKERKTKRTRRKTRKERRIRKERRGKEVMMR